VEDDLDIRDALSEALSMEGYSVKTSGNGKAALDYLNSAPEHPALILLDLMMPVMDGQQFILEKEKLAAFKAIPVMLMSADSNFHQNPVLIKSTVALVKKPIDLDQLVNLVKQYAKA
jgi:two-component system chemotaxis response regulator CheY